MTDPSEQQASRPFPRSQEQALAVFTSSGEAHRFVVGQMWQVTYLVLLAYVALAAAPPLIDDSKAGVNWVAMNLVCAFLAPVIVVLASAYLWSLYQADTKRLKEVYAAGEKLPVVLSECPTITDQP
jgi:hypothetical protein